MGDYASNYASLINSQNDSLGDIQGANSTMALESNEAIRNDAIQKQNDIDKVNQSDELGLLPELLKGADETDAAVFGLKTTLDLGQNLKTLGKQAREAKSLKEGLRAGIRETPLEEGHETAVFTRPFSSGAIAEGDDAPSFLSQLGNKISDTEVGQKVATYGKDIVQGAKDIKTGLSTAESVGKALVATAPESVSTAGKALAKIAPAAEIASGGLNIAEDVKGLVQGKSLSQAMGDNAEERWSNALGIAGSALTFVPGGDILGGILDVTSGVLDFFGEKNEAATKQAAAQQKINNINARATPTQAAPISTPGLASMGIISNFSKPQDTLIRGSGVF